MDLTSLQLLHNTQEILFAMLSHALGLQSRCVLERFMQLLTAADCSAVDLHAV